MAGAAVVPDFTGFDYSGPSSSGNSGGSGAVTDSGTNTSLAGLSGIFGAVGTAFSDAYRAVNPTVNPKTPGTLIYNPATGTYSSQAGLQTQGMMPLFWLLAAGVVIYLVLKR